MNIAGAANSLAASPIAFSYHQSFLYCRRVTRQANSTFPIAFQLLPPSKRRAMEALYAFLRISDDLADEAGEITEKQQRLHEWREGLRASFERRLNHPIHTALVDTVVRFAIPPKLLFDALDGVESDLEAKHFDTFDDLYPYCYRVASVVGLACVRVWGFRPGLLDKDLQLANEAAEAAGIAFQLTNILRDLKEDHDRGRVYLPLNEFNRFGISPDELASAACSSNFRKLIEFQIERARSYYRLAQRLARYLSNEGRAIFHVMMGMYWNLLTEIEKDVLGILTKRIRVPNWRKSLILLGGWSIKWGWR